MAVLSAKKYTKYTMLALLLSATALSSNAKATPFYEMGEDEQVSASDPYNYEYLNNYYRMNFDTSALEVNENVVWEENSGASESSSVQARLPNNDTRKFGFAVYSSSSVVIGHTAESGGVIDNTGSLDTSYNTFFSNYAEPSSSSTVEARGGAIYNHDGGHLNEMYEKEFIANLAAADSVARGGAIYNGENSKVDSMENVVFAGNFVQTNGGGQGVTIHAQGGAIYNTGTLDDIHAEFISNHADGANAEGGAIYNAGKMETSYGDAGKITGDFVSNYARGGQDNAKGGAIYNEGNTELRAVGGNFIGNYARADYSGAYGGAIANFQGPGINWVNSNFIGNYAKGNYAEGGAISNYYDTTIENISGKYVQNEAVGTIYNAYGGAISNSYNSIIDELDGVYDGNKAIAEYQEAYGGAVSNYGGSRIEKVSGQFVKNVARGDYAEGGAISNDAQSGINEVKAVFEENQAKGNSDAALGGAISNANGAEIDKLNAYFVQNEAVSENGDAFGGAVSNANGAEIGTVTADGTYGETPFYGNKAYSENGDAFGGAIYNGGEIGEISDVEFDVNVAQSENGNAYGGAIYNEGQITEIGKTNFWGNSVVGGADSKGGAIYTKADLFLNGDGQVINFDANTVNGVSNDVYVDNATITINASNGGNVSLWGGIDGNNYNIVIDGDGDGSVHFGQADNIKNLSFNNDGYLWVRPMTVINTQNMVANDGATPALQIDVLVQKNGSASANTMSGNTSSVSSGVINVSNQLSGNYDVIVSSLNEDGYEGAKTVFVNAPNDTNPDDESFNVARVIGSPYAWSALRNAEGTERGSVWYLAIPEGPTPPGPTPTREVTPEVIAGIGMQEAAVSQVRNLGRSIGNKVADSRLSCPGCGIVNYGWKHEPLRNVWLNAEGESLKSENAVDMDGKIWGVDAGFDLQADMNSAIGIFGSYRQGKYDYDGGGDKYYSKTGSDIDMDSYLGGLYYRYDRNMNWAMAMVYGGALKADVSTDDHIAKYDTDGYLIGAGLQFGHDFAIANGLLLEPSLGLYYNYISFDDATDNVGKEYKWDDMQYAEAEFGLKLEKQLPYQSKIYIKPSVIQTWRDGNSVRISKLKADTGDNQTLGRVEIGGRVGFTDALSGYTWANYTFGEHGYEATAAGAGLNYSW